MGQDLLLPMNGNSSAQLEVAETRTEKAVGVGAMLGGAGVPENCGVEQHLAEGNACVVRQQQQLQLYTNSETLGQLLKSALLIDVECCGFGYDIWYQNTTNTPWPRPR